LVVLEKWNPGVKVRGVFRDLPAIGAGEGVTGPCRVRTYRGKWQIEAGIRHFRRAAPSTLSVAVI
jgi:hypothetical protein